MLEGPKPPYNMTESKSVSVDSSLPGINKDDDDYDVEMDPALVEYSTSMLVFGGTVMTRYNRERFDNILKLSATLSNIKSVQNVDEAYINSLKWKFINQKLRMTWRGKTSFGFLIPDQYVDCKDFSKIDTQNC